ncbi:MAG: hypothetical protein NTW95_07835 [Candidatus Aminicenantes bacterium]|nr:hypothetical protein [Candidatus Aminicenantes bacterium]
MNNQNPKREKQYPISKVQKRTLFSSSYLKFGYWVLDIGYSSDSEKQYPITNNQYPISKVQRRTLSSLSIGYSSFSSSYLKFGYWVLDIGYSSSSYLDIGGWVLDIGYSSSSYLDIGYSSSSYLN